MRLLYIMSQPQEDLQQHLIVEQESSCSKVHEYSLEGRKIKTIVSSFR